MAELINRINCPNGCKNPIFTESVRVITESNTNLLNEGVAGSAQVKKVKTYNCNCCGQTFEMLLKENSRLLL